MRFVTVLGMIKCLKQVKCQRLLITCAPIMKEIEIGFSGKKIVTALDQINCVS